MKKFGLLPEDPTYTALFNACANSPWKEDGLQRAGRLRELMKEKDYQPNLITFKAMVKAYGILGDILTAFTLVDEIEAAGYRPDDECFSFLLMACISDSQAGFKLAIEVWKRMRKRKITPTIYQYNLMLRAIRDCGVGKPEFAQQLLHSTESPHQINTTLSVGGSRHNRTDVGSRNSPRLSVTGEANTTIDAAKTVQCLPEAETSLESIEYSDNIDAYKHWWQHDIKELTRSEKPDVVLSEPASSPTLSVLNMDVPNILNPRFDLRGLVHLQNLDKSEYRLGLLGGLPGILSHMQKDGVKPDIKTFSQLLEIIPSHVDAENDLLAAMTAHGIKSNVDMLNMLIRKRNKRRDFSGARDVLRLMARLELKPNVRTFGCLAMGCPKKKDGLQLLDDMQAAGILPNVEICNILIYQSGQDFSYKKAVCRTLTKLQIPPNESILQKIEYMIDKAKKETVRREHGEDVDDFYQTDYFISGFRDFMLFYKPWLLSMKVDRPEHAWASFRRPTHDKQDLETDYSS